MHLLYLYSTDISPTIEHGFEDDLEQLVEKATSHIKNQNHGNPYLSGFDAKALGADLEKGVKSAMKKQMVKKGDDIVPEQVKTVKSFPNGLKASLDWQGEKWNSSKPTLNDEGKYPIKLHWAGVGTYEYDPSGELREGYRDYLFAIIAVGKKGETLHQSPTRPAEKSQAASMAEARKKLAERMKKKSK